MYITQLGRVTAPVGTCNIALEGKDGYRRHHKVGKAGQPLSRMMRRSERLAWASMAAHDSSRQNVPHNTTNSSSKSSWTLRSWWNRFSMLVEQV